MRVRVGDGRLVLDADGFKQHEGGARLCQVSSYRLEIVVLRKSTREDDIGLLCSSLGSYGLGRMTAPRPIDLFKTLLDNCG